MIRFATVVVVVALSAGVVSAQNQLERFDRQLEQIQRETRVQADQAVPADQRATIDYGAYVSALFFSIDDPEQRTHILQQYDLVTFGRVNLDGAHEVYARVRTSYEAFRHHESFDGNDNDLTEPTLDRGYYRFDLQRYLASSKGEVIDGNVTIQAGRQLVVWGNGVALSEEFDGGVVDLSAGPLTLELLAGKTRPSVFDIDPSRPGFDGDTHRAFYGAMLSAQLGKQRPFLYFVTQNDLNDQNTLTSGTPPVTTNFDYNSYYIGAGSSGDITDNLQYSGEVVHEGGTTLSDTQDATGATVPQTESNINAWAADVRVDYFYNDPHRTRLSAEAIVATGDSDRRESTNTTVGGNRPGTDDTAFNGFGLLNTGYAFGTSVSNVVIGRVGASTFPWAETESLRRLQTGIDVFAFSKFDDDAPIDEPTGNNAWLGTEVDVYANWQITSDVTFQVRYGIFLPGSAPTNDHDPRNFLMLGVTYAF